MKKLRPSRIAIVLSGGVCLVCALYLSLPWIEFACLWAYRRDETKAERIAASLARDERGVDLALKDIDCYGGATRGWSSEVILRATDKDYVVRRLQELMHSGTVESKRIEAAMLLWEIGKDEDAVKFLQTCVNSESKTRALYASNYLARIQKDQGEVKHAEASK